MGVKTFNKANASSKQIEVYQDFSGGINTELADSATKDNQFRKLINFDMDKAGSISKRPGLYRIPYIKDIIMNKLNEEVVKGTIETLLDLKIDSCNEFFDGAHWIFNYITNKGIVVIILNYNLTIPTDLSNDLGDGEVVEAPYVLFYTDKVGDKSYKYNTKITKYNDIWILLRSFYAKPDWELDEQEKQVKLYSWNPIFKLEFKVDEAGGIIVDYDLSLFPGWYEANDDSSSLREETWYGQEETKIIKSVAISSLIPADTAPIEILSITPSSLVDCYDVTGKGRNVDVDYKNGLLTIITYENDIKVRTQNIILQHQDTSPIRDVDIAQIVYKDRDTLTVYLKAPVKYTRGFPFISTVPAFQKNICWFDVNIASGEKIYYKDISQISPTYKVSSFGSSPCDVKSFEVTYYSIPGATSRASRLIFSDLGIPYNFNLNIKGDFMWRAESYPKPPPWGINSKNALTTSLDYSNSLTRKDSGSLAHQIFNVTFWDVYNDFISFWTHAHFNFVGYTLFFFQEDIVTQYASTSTGYVQGMTHYFNDKLKQETNRSIYHYKNFGNIKEYWSRAGGGSFNSEHASYSFLKGATISTTTLDSPNIILADNKITLGSTSYKVSFKSGGKITNTEVNTAIINYDNFTFKSLRPSNMKDILIDNNSFPEDTIKVFGYQVFNKEELKLFAEVVKKYVITNVDLYMNYSVDKNSYRVASAFKTYQLKSMLEALLDDINPRINISYIKSGLNIYNLQMFYIDLDGKEHPLLDINNKLPQYNGNLFEILNTLFLTFVYDYTPNGFIEQVLNFKQLSYVKPNLNDLSYLWYNLLLFSNYNRSRYPDIYDAIIHPNISWDLIQYPRAEITAGQSIQLFGLVPVNNVVLSPGKQRFQLFYQLAVITPTPPKPTKEGEKPETPSEDILKNLSVAVTTMSITDYNAMINSPDFSSEGVLINAPAEDIKKKSPPWKDWEAVFVDEHLPLDDQKVWDDIKNEWVPAPKKAVIELTIPSTTSPYMILIQVANKVFGTDGKPTGKIQVASILETRIQMQPDQSYVEKINAIGLFDEFVSTKSASTYASNIVAYGSSNKLFFSDAASPSYFPLSRVIQLKTPEAIKSCVIFQNKLIVSTENSKSYVGGSSFDSSADPFYLREISTDSGLLAPKSEIAMGNYLYFLDTTGIKVLKNLYGTADKEFAFEILDYLIKTQVPKDREACATSFNNKYYICFPNYKYMLVYNFEYKAWVSYEGIHLNFSNMFENDGKLYGIDRDDFNIFRFDDEVFVDNWNEIEDGYVDYTSEDKTIHKVQKGTDITCFLQTKNFDQSYEPHRKKYDWALLNATIEGATSKIIPYILIDGNLINYAFSYYKNKNKEYNYIEDTPDSILIRDDSELGETTIVDYNSLGVNNNSYYNIPIQRSGNTIAFGFEHSAPSGLIINSLSIRYSLRDIKKNRRGIS